jgi:hypothetical protein
MNHSPRVAALLACVCAWFAALPACDRRSGPDPAPRAPEPDEISRLQALGYLDWVDVTPADAGEDGVSLLRPGRASPGANLYAIYRPPRARLVDLAGDPLHEWVGAKSGESWHHVELTPEGDLLAVTKGGGLLRLDWNSQLRWRTPFRVHHDVALDEQGRIYALSAESTQISWGARNLPIVAENIWVLAPDGRPLRKISLHALFAHRIAPQRLAAIADKSQGLGYWLRSLRGPVPAKGRASDVYHANSIEILDRDVAGLGSRGDALVSIRELDLVAVIDLDTERIGWSWGPGEIEAQHEPSVTADGTLLLFDNGRERGWSRVIEVDPASRRILWEYSGDPPKSLRSRRMGGAHQLANGNVLITESERGRAFEVGPGGEVVWIFYNPERNPSGKRRQAIYRMKRMPPAALAALPLSGSRPAASGR